MAKKRAYFLFMLLIAVPITAQAGDVTGKVSGAGADSVVWVDNPSGKMEVPSKPFIVDQKGLLFVPHVVVVPVGATVEFLNSDSVLHSVVFWITISGNKKLGENLGTFSEGQKRSFKFDNPSVVTLLCNLHTEMYAYVIVVPTLYYATTDVNGGYAIQNVTDGPHTITVWHEGMKQQSKQITVSGAAKSDFALAK